MTSGTSGLHLISVLTKALGKTIANQITDFLNANNLITLIQSGFRSGHSTASAVLHVTDDILIHFNRKQGAFLMLLDFSKAFDDVDHDLSRLKLRDRFSFDSSSVTLIGDFLGSVCTDRKLYVASASQLKGFSSRFHAFSFVIFYVHKRPTWHAAAHSTSFVCGWFSELYWIKS